MIHQLYDGSSLEIDGTESNVTYQFYTPDGKPGKKLSSKESPGTLTPRKAIGSEIFKHMEPAGQYRTKELVVKEFDEFILKLDQELDDIIVAKAEAHEADIRAEEAVMIDKISEGFDLLEETKNPLTWIANQIDWYTAGERMNILYAFLAYASQVVLQEPISVIAIGEGGSGKTHIEDVALSLMPEEYIITMKTATESSTYFVAEKDPYYFDGKIVNMGDLGGADDHSEAQAFKNLMKELQSDGYVKRIKQVKGEDGEWTNKEYELFGRPCITYTSVPGHDFDDQEMSRSIMLTPRMDNDLSVSRFKQLSNSKRNRTAAKLEQKKEQIPKIKNMLLALKDKMTDVEIQNPYHSFVEGFLKDSKFFKRDIDKYNGILKVITALNGYNRTPHMDTIFTTKADVIIFLDILEQYHDSIRMNLSPSAKDLYMRCRAIRERLDPDYEGFTVPEYIDRSGDTLSKRSIQRYFSELNANNLLKVVGKEGQNNLYIIADTRELFQNAKNDIKMSEYDIKWLKFNYDILSEKDFVVLVPFFHPGDIKKCVDPPYWNDFLPN